MLLMCELTAEGVLVSVNDNLAQLLGTAPDALVGQRFANLCHDGVQDPSAAPGFWQRVADGHNQVMAIRLAAPEGAPVWVRLSFGRMEGAQGLPARVLAVGIDISRDGLARFDALGTQLGAVRQGGDLHARVVVIELAVHIPALGPEQIADGVAQRRLAAMTHMQRPGRIRRDKLHQHTPTVRRPIAKPVALRQHLVHDLLLGLGLEPDVQKPRPRNLDGRRPALERR